MERLPVNAGGARARWLLKSLGVCGPALVMRPVGTEQWRSPAYARRDPSCMCGMWEDPAQDEQRSGSLLGSVILQKVSIVPSVSNAYMHIIVCNAYTVPNVSNASIVPR